MEQKKLLWPLLKTTVTQWFEDQLFQLASSLAYYTGETVRADVLLARFPVALLTRDGGI
jgi:uncharacterized BrkB/YihY/UPF0761 family membrane protein